MAQQQKLSGAGRFHAVRFYPDDRSLCRIVADFVGEGLVMQQPAIVIATPEHRVCIVEELVGRSFDAAALRASRDLLLLDAEAMLSKFMVDGMPDDDRFRSVIVPAIEKACAGRANCTVRAYGEMVNLLWTSGQTIAAVRLETLWNQLAQTHDFALLCGYSMGSFYKKAMEQEEICRHHTHVVAESGEAAVVN